MLVHEVLVTMAVQIEEYRMVETSKALHYDVPHKHIVVLAQKMRFDRIFFFLICLKKKKGWIFPWSQTHI